MILRRNAMMASLVGASFIALAGCAASNTGPEPEKVKEAIQSLGGSPETVLQQPILVKRMTDKGYADEVLFLVPSPDRKTFQVVDTRGEVFTSYEDFLIRNKLAE